ncbi:AraC family transcriptional regulator [Acaryochloris marina]|uniref:HTH araC/xylS-type domain-containing protein n=1 Tax=Acaryochloris marina (strain MBIC 11017) TaxID=329726 RepID=B0BYS4_ACAM1|nr:AraC family transcriptional regulator [Acaryochloris marina]ABW27090.1 conserved hypothetical protein [Acaryochloris marina MBIC11017]BDM81852.1 AraC family transcriptional regulator [Acaryochloris marina MBIC10699]
MDKTAPQQTAVTAYLNLPSSEQKGKDIHVHQFQNPPGEGQCQFEAEHTLFMSLAPRPLHYVQSQDGNTFTGLIQKGDFSLAPAGSPFFARWEGHEHCLEVKLTDQFVRKVVQETLEQDCDRISLVPGFRMRDPQIETIAMMLLTEGQQNTASSLMMDSLANVLTVHLLRQYATIQPHLPVYDGGIPQRQLAQVLDYMDVHLEQDLKLADLAQLLDMSQFHFSRLFKQSMGQWH